MPRSVLAIRVGPPYFVTDLAALDGWSKDRRSLRARNTKMTLDGHGYVADPNQPWRGKRHRVVFAFHTVVSLIDVQAEARRRLLNETTFRPGSIPEIALESRSPQVFIAATCSGQRLDR